MEEFSPLDLTSRSFPRRLRGYDPEEVRFFLSEIASLYERLLRERGELRQKAHEMERRLADHEARESALRDALVAAERSAERTVAEARGEGQRLIDDAQRLADRLIDDARVRSLTLESAITRLRDSRRDARAQLGLLVERFESMIDEDRTDEEQQPLAPSLALLQRRKLESGGS